MWYPSLYIGLVTLLLAARTNSFVGTQPNQRLGQLDTYSCFCLGSFGWYGLMWLWHELDGVPMNGDHWAAPVGGVYWMMSVLLPKFFVFRYPAKLFVVASLAFCLLAGRGVGAGRWLERLNAKAVDRDHVYCHRGQSACFLVWGSSAIERIAG